MLPFRCIQDPRGGKVLPYNVFFVANIGACTKTWNAGVS